MISKFGTDTALLLIDVQQGVDDLEHWGGPTARRNNPEAETVMLELLDNWRSRQMPVAFTRHDSREEASPLKFSMPGGRQKAGFELAPVDVVVEKDVNSGFVGTSLEVQLRRAGIRRLVVAGFFTNICVETTVRMAGNLGFDTYLVHDACSTTNQTGLDGTVYEPELVHDMTVANLHGEFCTALAGSEALALLEADSANLDRKQGNE